MVNELFFEKKKAGLYKLIQHCQKNVPYYHTHWDFVLPEFDEFTYEFFADTVPVLSKTVIRENSDLFIANGFKKEDLTIDVTSGTEGQPIICYKSKMDRIKHSQVLWRARRARLAGLKPKDKFVRFFAFRSDGKEIFTKGPFFYKDDDLHLSLLDLSPARLDLYWKEILQFKPRWVHGPSTAIYNLALHVKEHNLEPFRIELVELNGEYVPKEHATLIQEVFDCALANHYGSREFWAIGFSCEHDNIKVLDESVYVETVYNPKCQAKEVFVTSLINHAWPLVRYPIGDIGELKYAECCDSLGEFSLEIRKGRRADYFTFSNGQMINAIVFSAIARGTSEIFKKTMIQQYQIIKDAADSLVIRLRSNCLDSLERTKILELYDTELRKIIGKLIKVEYQFVDFISPDPKTGKTKDFIDLTKSF